MRFRLPWIALGLPFTFLPIAEAQLSYLQPGGPSPTIIGNGKTAASISTNVTLQSALGASLVFESHGLLGPDFYLGQRA
jgi:hypothetical protein